MYKGFTLHGHVSMMLFIFVISITNEEWYQVRSEPKADLRFSCWHILYGF